MEELIWAGVKKEVRSVSEVREIVLKARSLLGLE